MTQKNMLDLSALRQDYLNAALSEADVDTNPLTQFAHWFNEAQTAQVPEPNAMTLATVSEDGQPSARIVLIKEARIDGVVWFTNYDSRKGQELADNARAAVVIGDKVFTADAVKISHEAKVKRYYAIGEENPYAAVAGKAVYTIVLHGFSGGEEALPGEFTLQTGGARYTHCVLKAASENKLVIEAGACEKITRRTQSGTEA